jgi:hypothetical protein
MHNVMSSNQLADWRHPGQKSNDEMDLANDYFDCLIECDDSQSVCKRICRRLLN